MSVQNIYYSEDGVEKAFIRALDGAGQETGPFLEIEGISQESFTRNVVEREVLANNRSFKKDSKFQNYSGDVTIHALRHSMMEFYQAGALSQQGNVSTFTEDPTSLPKRFALYITYPLDGSNGEPGKGYTCYPNCRTGNFQKARTTGEYVEISLTIDALVGANGSPKIEVIDSDGVGLDVSGDVTPPAIVSTVPAQAASGVAVGSDIVVTFSKSMAPTSLGGVILYRVSTGAVVPTEAEYVESGGPPANSFVLTVSPESDLAAGASYTLLIPSTVRDASGNFLEELLAVTFETDA